MSADDDPTEMTATPPGRRSTEDPEDDFMGPPPGWGWSFHYAIDCLEKAFGSARKAAQEAQAELDAAIKDHRDAVAKDMAPWLDEGDWEQYSIDYREHLGELYYEEHTTLRLVTEAFIIALWHLWERQLNASMYRVREIEIDKKGRERTKEYRYKHDAAMGWLKRHGFKADEARLMQLKLLAETLKHSEGRSAENLFRHRRDLFDPNIEDADFAAYEWVRIDEETFVRFAEIVRGSGPQDRKLRL